jgi:anti-sigma B factor antagonist
MNAKEGDLRLFGMRKPVQAMFELVRMHRLFAIYDTEDEACATL